MGSVFQPSTTEDHEYAWRHAFAYADCHVTTEEAVMYANHYAKLIADEEVMGHWPAHSPTFANWLRH